jgi:membrane protease subunit (stomatin/prohibitin family)
MLFFKKKVSFNGDVNHLISKHDANSYDKNQLIEIPRGYSVILMEANGRTVTKTELEFKLTDKTKYVYYVKSTKNIFTNPWGTPSRIEVKTKQGNIVTLGGYGTFEFKLSNPIKYINTKMNTLDFVDIDQLSAVVLSKIIDLFQETSTKLPPIDESDMTQVTLNYKSKLLELLKERLDDNGIEVIDFMIDNLNLNSK